MGVLENCLGKETGNKKFDKYYKGLGKKQQYQVDALSQGEFLDYGDAILEGKSHTESLKKAKQWRK